MSSRPPKLDDDEGTDAEIEDFPSEETPLVPSPAQVGLLVLS